MRSLKSAFESVAIELGQEFSAGVGDSIQGAADLFRAPVKLGHEMLQSVFGDLADDLGDGEPAFGWIANVRREGGRLLADFTDVPAKLAQYLKVRAWRTRSPEVHFNYEVAGEKYRRMLTAVSLLGAVPPAIEGMADLYRKDGDEAYQVLFAAGDDASELDAILADLRSLRDRWEKLAFNRRGVRRMRRLFEAFEADLGRVARANLAKDDDMGLTELRAALGLDDDADDESIVVALSKADESRTR